ncbi:MAG: hypothetical protein R3E32_18395 [Chitinophagales bacterium]
MDSLDPRVNRLDLQKNTPENETGEHQHGVTYEILVQKKRGAQHIHVGSLHAASHEMALVLAKEQYGRRDDCFNIWVVKTTDIFALNIEDEDMFATNRDKKYRLSSGFKVSDKITAFKKAQNELKSE